MSLEQRSVVCLFRVQGIFSFATEVSSRLSDNFVHLVFPPQPSSDQAALRIIRWEVPTETVAFYREIFRPPESQKYQTQFHKKC